MKSIDIIIFNTLASRRGINLPEIGAFIVEREPAKLEKGKKLTPPVNKIRFTREEQDGFVHIIKEIAHQGKITLQEADTLYRQWLEDSDFDREKLEMTIDGVGELKHQRLIPTRELAQQINPSGAGKQMQLKSAYKPPYITIAISVLAVSVIGVFLYLFVFNNKDASIPVPEIPVAKVEVKIAEDTLLSALIKNHANRDTLYDPDKDEGLDSIERALIKQTEQNATVDPVAGQGNKPASARQTTTKPAPSTTVAEVKKPAENKPAATKPTLQPEKTAVAAPANVARYHVILGVFGVEENADKLIEQIRSGDARLNLTKIKRGSKFMVSGYSSSTEGEAIKFKESVVGKYPNAWIHSEPAKI